MRGTGRYIIRIRIINCEANFQLAFQNVEDILFSIVHTQARKRHVRREGKRRARAMPKREKRSSSSFFSSSGGDDDDAVPRESVVAGGFGVGGEDGTADDDVRAEKKKRKRTKGRRARKMMMSSNARSEGKEKEEKEESKKRLTTAKEMRKKRLDESKALVANAPAVSVNWQKLVARGDIRTSEKGKHRKHDFDPSTKENDGGNTTDATKGDGGKNNNELRKPTPTSRDASVTEIVAMDCEMVGVGEDGSRSVLARVTVVNEYGNVILDTFVQATERVTDYRTKVSGVRPRDLKNAPKFVDVQKMVSKLIDKKIVVGHGLKNDFRALLLNHPRERTRDTALYHLFTRPLRSTERCVEGAPRGRGSRSLKELTRTHLRMTIQDGEHSSAEDARAALFLYAKYKRKWEKSLKKR